MWRGLAATGGRADARAPARGVSEEAGLAEGRAACLPPAPPRPAPVCARVRVGRAAAEGGREAAAGPAPGRRARGGSSASWDRRALA